MSEFNDILELKGRLRKRGNASRPMPPVLNRGDCLSASEVARLVSELESVASYWREHQEIEGALVGVYYKGVVAKTKRVCVLLADRKQTSASSIRGARFNMLEGHPQHVFIHYVPIEIVERSIRQLRLLEKILREGCGGTASGEDLNRVGQSWNEWTKDLPRSLFPWLVHDVLNVKRFDVDIAPVETNGDAMVSIYRTNVDVRTLLSRFGIDIRFDRISGEDTVLLHAEEVKRLKAVAPYLVSMGVTDLRDFTAIDMHDERFRVGGDNPIPPPANEPIVGVLDTRFDPDVSFRDWVEYHDELGGIPREEGDATHGTGVSSIIVDGPRLNPTLQDDCGRFRVRHFGILPTGRFSSFAVMKKIREIIMANQDIKVWNVSFGSTKEINQNFISYEAAELDALQNEFDVVFVVAGTNVPSWQAGCDMFIGAPADSVNSVVVNSVNGYGEPASYTRHGPVLSFFRKPDIAYYGGDDPNGRLMVEDGSYYAVPQKGTSFAAPWITRKMAFLIQKMHLSREIAKALLVDAAAKWDGHLADCVLGYGVVPKSINDVLHTQPDEIKFFIRGISEDYYTFTYELPVPLVADKYPFVARATMVYFPRCQRNQGVDYTSSELNVKFGRVAESTPLSAKIVSINKNRQGEEAVASNTEVEARRLFRKWDNIKYIGEKKTGRTKAKKSYQPKMWGLEIANKARNVEGMRELLPFGLVVTLKEITGRNRLPEFATACGLRGWIVHPLDVNAHLDVVETADTDVEME